MDLDWIWILIDLRSCRLDPECVKAHYRKAQALALFKKDLQGAIRAVKILLSIDKGNKPALAMMQNLQQQSDDAQSTTAQAIKVSRCVVTVIFHRVFCGNGT